jgi:hypothetical protein
LSVKNSIAKALELVVAGHFRFFFSTIAFYTIAFSSDMEKRVEVRLFSSFFTEGYVKNIKKQLLY